MKCNRCKKKHDDESMVYERADGKGKRLYPLCPDCHQEALKGLKRSKELTVFLHFKGAAPTSRDER